MEKKPVRLSEALVSDGKNGKNLVKPGDKVETLLSHISLYKQLGGGPFVIAWIGEWPRGRVMLFLKMADGNELGFHSSDFKSSAKNLSNRDAYLKEKDTLIEEHHGEYAAYNGGHRIGLGTDKDEVYKQAKKKIPQGFIFIQQIISDEEMRAEISRPPRFFVKRGADRAR